MANDATTDELPRNCEHCGDTVFDEDFITHEFCCADQLITQIQLKAQVQQVGE